jgi:hypothetical protein
MRLLGALPVAALLFSALDGSAAAQTLTYVLKPGSSIASICRGCKPGAPQALTGTFDLTPLPLDGTIGVAAITNVNFTAPSLTIGGNGFIQRFDEQHHALVIDMRLGDEHVLLSGGKSQFGEDHAIRAVLTSRGSPSRRYVLVLSAAPRGGGEHDADYDGVPDSGDNCATMPNADQRDDDSDGVGNPCDLCSDGTTGSPVGPDGCRTDQLCPCHATMAGASWEDQGAYLRCVSRSLRTLRRLGLISRGDAIKALRKAGRSSCGRTVVASCAAAALAGAS